MLTDRFRSAALKVVPELACEYPSRIGNLFVGCYKCIGCRRRRVQVWASRIRLEARLHPESCFATLTYDEDHLPAGGSLQPMDLVSLMKALRKRQAPQSLRFFGVGEYGGTLGRPHYHVILFGMRGCHFGRTRNYRPGGCCPSCDAISASWQGRGQVMVGPFEDGAAEYVSSYIQKGLNRKGHLGLEGRHPEFSRMSRRPGIGVGFLPLIKSHLEECNRLPSTVDAPAVLRNGSKSIVLGPFLKGKLREMLFGDKKAPYEALVKLAEDVKLIDEVADAVGMSAHDVVLQRSAGRIEKLKWQERNYRKSLR